MKVLRRVSNIKIIVFLFCSLPCIHGKFVPQDFEENLTALAKVVNYVYQRPQQMNADATFSITIVEANVAAMLFHKNARYLHDEYWETLLKVLKICDRIRRYLLDTIAPENEDIQLLHETLNDPTLWMQSISWKNGTLDTESPTLDELINQNVRELIMQGTPKEEESDRCLAEIIRNKLSLNYRIPEVCLDILQRRDVTRGYPLTHRLLIIQVAKAMKCDNNLSTRTSDVISLYCSAILRDLIDIEAYGFPYNTADLMMEEVLLCGMEGFLEFTDRHYEKLLLNWSHPSGCFSSFVNKFSRQPRLVRRSSTLTDFGCDSHATGLAAASLSLFIRQNVENAFK
ncbi:UPF0764 protein C16orf89 homolog [Calliopsis andreniformis]|uniref:UPF0764 protein C16orf89 homolog n=1 Tax=Calliopsis andreniformis TaxID=337506 RepID=UPI003FCE1602